MELTEEAGGKRVQELASRLEAERHQQVMQLEEQLNDTRFELLSMSQKLQVSGHDYTTRCIALFQLFCSAFL